MTAVESRVRGVAVAPEGTTGPSGPIGLVCRGCGRSFTPETLLFRCPAAADGDDIDHVVGRTIPAGLTFPEPDDPNPFVRYRTLFGAWHAARDAGWSDGNYVSLVRRLDRTVAEIDGRAFRETPLLDSRPLADRLGFGARGAVLVKDETGNVSGSHKARHLMGTLIELEVAEANAARPGSRRPSLAIASCGNAALAAAVVARAAGRTLDVFVPPDAHPAVVARLEVLGARLTVCERGRGTTGDPTYHRLREAIAGGAIPFTCQGNENGYAIEGGETLGWELVSQLGAMGRSLDRLFIQVGGGALGSSCVQALAEARALGATDLHPRIHAVQTTGAAPLVRAYDLVATRLLSRFGGGGSAEARVERLRQLVSTGAADEELTWIARHRSAFMWPWETEPHSAAHGILDDETYDWFELVRGMLESGGGPVVVDEELVREANDLGRETTAIDADETGTAGLAGLIALRRGDLVDADETVAVLFTGARRGSPADASVEGDRT